MQVPGHSLANDLYVTGNVPAKDILPIIRNLANRGDAEQAGALGRVFHAGLGGIARNDAEAFHYTVTAATGGALWCSIARTQWFAVEQTSRAEE